MTLLFALGALLAGVPALASTAACTTQTTIPVATGCAQIESNFFNGTAFVNSFDGNFVNDNNIQVFDVILSQDATIVVQTYSYSGGTDLAGDVVTPPGHGGFATELALYSQNGNFAGKDTFSGDCGVGNTNGFTGNCLDTTITATLTAGTYYLALTENDNLDNGSKLFSSGTTVTTGAFNEGSNTTFTSSFCNGSATAPFCDTAGNQMTSFYYLDIAIDAPEPSSFVLLSAALAGLLFALHRRRRPVEKVLSGVGS